MVLKMFAPGDFIFPEVSAPHETCPRWSTNSALAIGIIVYQSHFCETVNIRGFRESISVTPKGIRFEVV